MIDIVNDRELDFVEGSQSRRPVSSYPPSCNQMNILRDQFMSTFWSQSWRLTLCRDVCNVLLLLQSSSLSLFGKSVVNRRFQSWEITSDQIRKIYKSTNLHPVWDLQIFDSTHRQICPTSTKRFWYGDQSCKCIENVSFGQIRSMQKRVSDLYTELNIYR